MHGRYVHPGFEPSDAACQDLADQVASVLDKWTPSSHGDSTSKGIREKDIGSVDSIIPGISNAGLGKDARQGVSTMDLSSGAAGVCNRKYEGPSYQPRWGFPEIEFEEEFITPDLQWG